MVVCEYCGCGGEAGPLLRIGHVKPAKYRHRMCQATSGEIPNMPVRNHPKLWIAQVRPPELKDLHV